MIQIHIIQMHRKQMHRIPTHKIQMHIIQHRNKCIEHICDKKIDIYLNNA